MISTEAHRRFYAQYVVKSAGSSDARLIAAFSAVPREDFLGPGPWPIHTTVGYLPTISAEPYLLYQDILVGIDTFQGINNGQPSLHARCLAAVAPASGEIVVHVGAGTGYYTAILANLVAPDGGVRAFEIDRDLAARAKENLRTAPSVEVVTGSAAEADLGTCDVVYVSAGATHPPAAWLDALNVGGRLVLPLTPNSGWGCMLLITKRSRTAYAAAVITRAAFIPCIGARDEKTSKSLAAALERESLDAVRSLRRGVEPDDTAWCIGDGWWLSMAEPIEVEE